MVVPAPRRPPRRRAVVIAVVLLALIGSAFLARFYTDLLWFREVGFQSVLYTTIATQFLVGLVAGVVVAAFIYLNLWIAARGVPAYPTLGRSPLDQYRELLTPYLSLIRLGISVLIGIGSGIVAASRWQSYLLWSNRVDFGVTDPQFGRDVGFYVFDLPFFNGVAEQLYSVLFTALLFSAGAHFFYGAIDPQRRLAGITSRAVAHLSVLLGLLALVKAVQYWLGTYGLNFSPRGVVTGASYTDVNAQLPALRLLVIISVISAVLFLVNIRVRRVSLPIAAVGIWILTAVLAGGVWPTVVQRFSVEPQEFQREQPYIERNLAATNQAFGLSDVETKPFAASADLTIDEARANQPILDNVRLWDPDVLKQAYAQLQSLRTYYDFPDVEVDRYVIDGEMREVMLSAREISVEDLPEESRKWANIHLQYTHGFGIVASLANSRTSAGQPSFLVRDVPGTVVPGAETLEAEQPRLYYGEAFDDDEYSIVNTKQEELDYESDEGVQRSSYEGKGGIELGGLFRKLAFALREGDPNFVLSNLLESDSRVLIYRNVRDRVRRAAPFLDVDQDPYPVLLEGRITWVLDAYTSTRWFPYSQRFDADDVVEGDPATLSGDVNYVRNSVKVAIDAYDGSLTFYIVDPTDPLIQAWRNAFPELFTDEEPPPELQAHFRYPEDLFKLQTEVYRTYHIDDALDFYSKQDAWDIAETAVIEDDEVSIEGEITPIYLLFQLPGEAEQEFMLTRPFTPRARPNMVSFMAARSDPEHYGELVLLQFPVNTTVPGPVQVDNLINQDVEISRELTLLDQRGSNASFGSLVILPIEDSILYIQPLFVTAQSGGIPELKRVFMVHGEKVAMAETFEEALVEVLGGEPLPEPEPEPEPGDGEEPPDEEPGSAEELLAQAAELYERAQEALAEGDFATYGKLIERLGDLLRDARTPSPPRS